MGLRNVGWSRLALGLLTLLTWLSTPVSLKAAQINQPGPGGGAGFAGWGEVITATEEWIVVQNEQGQQFPIALDATELFVIRWPTSVDRLTEESWVEVTGVNLGSFRLETSHADVYEGSARAMVSPTVFEIHGAGQVDVPTFGFNNPFGPLTNALTYGAPFPGMDQPIQGGVMTGPRQLHAVGPAVNRNPLQVAVPGNNVVTVIPIGGAMTMTQITRGDPQFVRPGDMAYLMATSSTPKTLVLSQLVIYKRMPRNQFVP